MFYKRYTLFLAVMFSLSISLFSCKSKFEKLRSTTGLAEKYKMAVSFYDQGKYEKAYVLFNDLIQRYRGRENADQLYYYFAYTHFKQKDYITARYHFKNLADTYKNSVYAEESRFMAGYTYYLTSPKVNLDQGDTYRAIENLQYFISSYPDSEWVSKCRRYIEELEDKLQRKALLTAKLYYDQELYKAASVAYKNTLLDFPDSPYAEEIFFKAFKSQYLYAERSFYHLRQERYETALDMFNDFEYRFPESTYMDEAVEIKNETEERLDKLETDKEQITSLN